MASYTCRTKKLLGKFIRSVRSNGARWTGADAAATVATNPYTVIVWQPWRVNVFDAMEYMLRMFVLPFLFVLLLFKYNSCASDYTIKRIVSHQRLSRAPQTHTHLYSCASTFLYTILQRFFWRIKTFRHFHLNRQIRKCLNPFHLVAHQPDPFDPLPWTLHMMSTFVSFRLHGKIRVNSQDSWANFECFFFACSFSQTHRNRSTTTV